MASGLVAKKIALFELKPPTTEQTCRLKRKHAIRRKKYRRDRKPRASAGSFSEALSDDNLEDSSCYSSSEVTSSLSASCSALLDLIYQPQINFRPEKKLTLDLAPVAPSVTLKDKNKRIFCRSSSLEIFPTRLNIVDIDIEIRVEKKSPSPDASYEPLEFMDSNVIDKIKITATMDRERHTREPGGATPSNYLCTSCGSSNNSSKRNSDSFQDHIYENFSNVPPPRPPKSGVGVPTSVNYNSSSYSTESTKTTLSSLTLGPEKQSQTDQTTDTADSEEDEKREPFYEDLYDYCNTPTFLMENENSLLQPVALLPSFIDNDKDEEVEYCDCSTVMAMAINSLNTRDNEPVVSSGRTQDAPYNMSTSYGTKTNETNEEKRQETKITAYTINSTRSPLTSAIKVADELTDYYSSQADSHYQRASAFHMMRSKYGSQFGRSRSSSELYGDRHHLPDQLVDQAAVTNDSKDKKDEDEHLKPLPIPPETCSLSASSSDSFYSEPIYGITNQITNNGILKNPGPPVPDTLERPSLSPNPHSNNISCNNVLRSPPVPAFPSKINTTPSIASGSIYGYGGSMADYADSMSNPIPNKARPPASDSNFAPNDKLPPIPPSKFSSIAKSAGRRIAKKILNIRKTSRSSLENFDAPSSSSSSTNGSLSGRAMVTPGLTPSLKTSSGTSTPTGSNTGVQGPVLKRAISRPSIPPPEPPKSVYGGSSNGSTNNYSIYGKSEGNNRNHEEDDDDFDDSDFYDSDSELIKNFVSQVQPIYSMEEEPLYQYYTYGISLKPDDDYQPVIPKNLGLSLDMLVPRVGQRTLWCELPEVTASGILSILSDKQKQLQEAIFEILTSEVSYLKSLDVLIAVFYKNEELIGVLNEEERGFLFGNIQEVRNCAQAFLAELLGKWEESWYIQDIGEAINTNANTRFSVYKEYCRNKPYQDKTMQNLRHSRDEFVNVMKTLEEDSRCQMLRVDSFLMLPMQRITRLPLLVNAVIQRTTSVKEKAHCEEALKSLTNLVLSCNEAARESQDAEETSAVLDKLEYPRGSRVPPSLGQFIMKGDFMKNPFDHGRGNQLNWTFRKTKRTFYWVVLFSNQLLVTKRKTNGRFEVLDTAMPEDSTIKPLPNLEGVANDFQHFFMLHFDKKETVYFLAARTNSEIERWKGKLESMKTEKKFQVEAIFPYVARRADELSFNAGDIINVSQMQPDGWYYGSKVNGGQMGWFPGNYGCEV